MCILTREIHARGINELKQPRVVRALTAVPGRGTNNKITKKKNKNVHLNVKCLENITAGAINDSNAKHVRTLALSEQITRRIIITTLRWRHNNNNNNNNI